jgi:hypothetical protein
MKKELEVGDRVRIKQFKKRPPNWNCDGEMDHLMGQVVEIRCIVLNAIIIKGYPWRFSPSDFEEIISVINEPELTIIL